KLSSNLELQLHPVIRKLHILRQIRICLFMRQVMTNVRKKSTPRFQPLHCLQRVLNCRMCRVRLVTQCVQKQHIESLKLSQRAFRNHAVISEVSRRSKTKAITLRLAVNQHDRLESRPEQLHRSIDWLQLDMRQSAEFVICIEDVPKHIADKFRRLRMRI